MPYTVRSSERTRGAGAEYETKALLYLMNFSHHRDEIHFFVVDFFNDLTGMDRYSDKLWDLQSKGAKNNWLLQLGVMHYRRSADFIKVGIFQSTG